MYWVAKTGPSFLTAFCHFAISCQSINSEGVANKVTQTGAVPHFHEMRVVEHAEAAALAVYWLVGGYIYTLSVWVF